MRREGTDTNRPEDLFSVKKGAHLPLSLSPPHLFLSAFYFPLDRRTLPGRNYNFIVSTFARHLPGLDKWPTLTALAL